jgi:hypothetical protein
MKIKKLLLAVLFLTNIAFAHAQAFKNGDLNINAGIGLGYTYGFYSGASSWPLLYVSGEKGVTEVANVGVVSVGALIAFKHISFSDAVDNNNWSWNDLYVGGRGALHFSGLKVDKLDVYAGASLGLRFYSYPTLVYNGGYDYSLENKTHTTLFFGLFGGGKYYLSDKIAVFGELGWDVAWIKLGVTIKI